MARRRARRRSSLLASRCLRSPAMTSLLVLSDAAGRDDRASPSRSRVLCRLVLGASIGELDIGVVGGHVVLVKYPLIALAVAPALPIASALARSRVAASSRLYARALRLRDTSTIRARASRARDAPSSARAHRSHLGGRCHDGRRHSRLALARDAGADRPTSSRPSPAISAARESCEPFICGEDDLTGKPGRFTFVTCDELRPALSESAPHRRAHQGLLRRRVHRASQEERLGCAQRLLRLGDGPARPAEGRARERDSCRSTRRASVLDVGCAVGTFLQKMRVALRRARHRRRLQGPERATRRSRASTFAAACSTSRTSATSASI